jgi:UV DNA damage endonuclease
MIRHLGYACIALGTDASSSRTCRVSNATPTRLRELIEANLDGVAALLRYNVEIGVRLFRLSSQIVPFASHPVNAIRWWDEFAAQLAELGAYAQTHQMRLSLHPGQYTVLSSPRPEVVRAAIADLEYHARLLDAMGLGPEHKVIVHGGGTYGDKSAAIERWVSAYRTLPAYITARLVVENDERSYTAHDVLAINRQTGVPVVFDALHDHVLPSPGDPSRSALLQNCFATWRVQDGPPKVHFSSQNVELQAGAHDDWIDPDGFLRFVADTGSTEVDCMLEAKKKDFALRRLRDQIPI